MRTVSRTEVSSASDAFAGVRHFGSLDGLRALSVLAVVWHHTAGTGAAGPGGSRQPRGRVLLRDQRLPHHDARCCASKRATARVSLRDFYARRTLRIFPRYYATLGLYVLLTLGTGRRDTAAGQDCVANLPSFLTYASNWFVEHGESVTFYFAWSLATEEQFYLFWPPCSSLRWPWGRDGDAWWPWPRSRSCSSSTC